MTLTLLGLAALAAVVDWVAVARSAARCERVAKPLTLVLLLAAAASGSLSSSGPWLLAGLALGLVGDVALLVARDDGADPDPWFLAGLGAFLLGHGAYLVAFVRHGLPGGALIAGAVITVVAAAPVLPRVLRAVAGTGDRVLTGAVAGYAATLAAMTVLAVGTGSAVVAAGGVLFLASDSVLAWDRFVARHRAAPVVVAVTYHLAQGLIVVGLLHGHRTG